MQINAVGHSPLATARLASPPSSWLYLPDTIQPLPLIGFVTWGKPICLPELLSSAQKYNEQMQVIPWHSNLDPMKAQGIETMLLTLILSWFLGFCPPGKLPLLFSMTSLTFSSSFQDKCSLLFSRLLGLSLLGTPGSTHNDRQSQGLK